MMIKSSDWCRALMPNGKLISKKEVICTLPKGHKGDHRGVAEVCDNQLNFEHWKQLREGVVTGI